eukprot:GSMAST32.ASY1.ANO1.2466.1 assembled CDS
MASVEMSPPPPPVLDTKNDATYLPVKADAEAGLSWKDICFSVGNKQILNHVSGSSSSFTAIMGPSGAGKSTLLNILSGRVQPSRNIHIGGSVSFNGEDALFATQTPREAFHFSAALRLPNISGGEKKRTAIGIELISNPKILFLDEPTSGLDSYAAFKVVQNLSELSKSGRTILCTIHQPSSEVFSVFDEALLLCDGKLIYHDRRDKMIDYFAKHNYLCPKNYNPADFVMFLLQEKSTDCIDKLCIAVTKDNDTPITKVHKLAFFNSGFFTQLSWLCKREMKQVLRDKAKIVALTIKHFGVLTFLITGAMFGLAQPTILSFPMERPIFLREYAGGVCMFYFFSISNLFFVRNF